MTKMQIKLHNLKLITCENILFTWSNFCNNISTTEKKEKDDYNENQLLLCRTRNTTIGKEDLRIMFKDSCILQQTKNM